MRDGFQIGRDIAIFAVCCFIVIAGPTTCANVSDIADSLRVIAARA